MRINCDLGEGGVEHPADIALMDHIHIANIACGGHAGDARSASFFRELAERKKVMVTAHLSYPDRVHFGRVRPDIPQEDLEESLDAQMKLLPGIHAVKFHGTLYNDSVTDGRLSDSLAAWARARSIDTLIAPHDSNMARSCTETGIRVLFEAFAERRYTRDPESGTLVLVNRSKPYAVIADCRTALAQALKIVLDQKVGVVCEGDFGELPDSDAPIRAETLCIHSDSPIALPLAEALSKALRQL